MESSRHQAAPSPQTPIPRARLRLPGLDDTHEGWASSNVATSKCDICHQPRCGTIQKCLRCSMSICKKCAFAGRLDGNETHALDPDAVSWGDQPSGQAHKSMTPRPRVSRNTRSRVTGVRQQAARSYPTTLRRPVSRPAMSLLRSERPLPTVAQPQRSFSEALESKVKPDEVSPEVSRAVSSLLQMASSSSPPSRGQTQERNEEPTLSDILPHTFHVSPSKSLYSQQFSRPPRNPHHTQDIHSDFMIPEAATVYSYYSTDDTPADSNLQRQDHRTRLAPVHPHTPGVSQGFHTTLPVYEPSLPDSDVHDIRPAHSRRRSSLTDPLSHNWPTSRYGGSRESFRPSPVRIVTPPEAKDFSPGATKYNSTPPAPISGHVSRFTTPETHHQLSSTARQMAMGVAETTSIAPAQTGLPQPDVVYELGSELHESSQETKSQNPDLPLDFCLRLEVERVWSSKSLSQKTLAADGDEAESFRILLAATYFACILLKLHHQNAARSWLCEQERRLRGRGLVPIRSMHLLHMLRGQER